MEPNRVVGVRRWLGWLVVCEVALILSGLVFGFVWTYEDTSEGVIRQRVWWQWFHLPASLAWFFGLLRLSAAMGERWARLGWVAALSGVAARAVFLRNAMIMGPAEVPSRDWVYVAAELVGTAASVALLYQLARPLPSRWWTAALLTLVAVELGWMGLLIPPVSWLDSSAPTFVLGGIGYVVWTLIIICLWIAYRPRLPPAEVEGLRWLRRLAFLAGVACLIELAGIDWPIGILGFVPNHPLEIGVVAAALYLTREGVGFPLFLPLCLHAASLAIVSFTESAEATYFALAGYGVALALVAKGAVDLLGKVWPQTLVQVRWLRPLTGALFGAVTVYAMGCVFVPHAAWMGTVYLLLKLLVGMVFFGVAFAAAGPTADPGAGPDLERVFE